MTKGRYCSSARLTALPQWGISQSCSEHQSSALTPTAQRYGILATTSWLIVAFGESCMYNLIFQAFKQFSHFSVISPINPLILRGASKKHHKKRYCWRSRFCDRQYVETPSFQQSTTHELRIFQTSPAVAHECLSLPRMKNRFTIFRRVSIPPMSQDVVTRAARLGCARGLAGSDAHFG
jgi:hypothetical protein